MTAPPASRRPFKSNPDLTEPCEVFEVDDVLVTRFFGNYTLELAMELQPRSNAIAARCGYRLLLINVRRLGTVTREARRYLVEDQQRQGNDRKASAVAVVGANFATRTLATMLIRAVSSLTKQPASLAFFEMEEQGFAWLEQERNRLRTMVSSNNFS